MRFGLVMWQPSISKNRCLETKSDFLQRLETGKPKIIGHAEKIETLFAKVVEEHFGIGRAIAEFKQGALAYVAEDIEKQLAGLLHESFLSETGLVWFTEYPRYLKAISVRLSKAPHMGDKDKPNTELLSQYWLRYTALDAKAKASDKTELQALRWMLEEFRVSLFAQTLGTRIAVSEKRINKLFETLH